MLLMVTGPDVEFEIDTLTTLLCVPTRRLPNELFVMPAFKFVAGSPDPVSCMVCSGVLTALKLMKSETRFTLEFGGIGA